MSALFKKTHTAESATQLRPAAGVCAPGVGVGEAGGCWQAALAGWRRQTGAPRIKGSAPVSDKHWISAVISPLERDLLSHRARAPVWISPASLGPLASHNETGH